MRAKISVASLFVLLFMGLFATNATAHSDLISQNPMPSSEIQEMPPILELTFNEELLDLGSGNEMQMLDPNGDVVTTGDLMISSATLSSKLGPTSVLGEYYVSYRAVSTDGHVVAGEYTFTLLASDETIKAEPTATPLVEQKEDQNTQDNTGLIVAAILAALLTSGFVFWRLRARK